MILFIIILVFLLILTGLLVMPVILVIDTDNNKYFVRLYGFVKAWLQVKEEINFRMRILFFNINLTRKVKKSRSKTRKSNKKYRRISLNKIKFLIHGVFKRIKIKKLRATIDTGDFSMNALLIPVAQKLNNESIQIQINFHDINSLDFIAETRLYKLLILYIKSIILIKN